MKRVLIFIFLLLILPIFLNGTNSKIDSLIQILPELSDKKKLNTYFDLVDFYQDADPQKSIFYGNKALHLAEKFDDKVKKSNLLSRVGVAYEYLGNFSKALEYYNESIDIASSIDDQELIGSATINIAVAYQKMAKYDYALDYNLKALQIYHDLGNEYGIVTVMNNLGNTYLNLDRYDKALQYYLEAKDKKLSLPKAVEMSSAYHNIALVNQILENYDEAIKYYDLALKEMKKNNERYSLAVCYENISKLYYSINDYDKSLFFVNEALHIFENLQNVNGMCSAKLNLANIQIVRKKFKIARQNLDESLQLALENDLSDKIVSNYEIYARYYEARKDYGKALDYFKKFKTLDDSLKMDLNNQQIAEMSIQYDTIQSEKEIELLKQKAVHDHRIKNLLIYVIIFGIVVTIILLNLYYEKIKDGKIRQEIQEKLKTSEIKYRTLTENLKVAVYIFNTEGNFTYVNKATSDITGYTEAELLQMPFSKVVHPKHKDLVVKRGMARIRGENVISNYEFMILAKNGEERWVESSNIRISVGGVIMVMGSAINITERKHAHTKLEESESRLKALFAAMDDVIFTLDRRGTYLYVAPTNPDLLYRPSNEILGRKLHEIFPKEKADEFSAKIKECLTKNSLVTFDYNMLIKNDIYWFEGKITPLDKEKVLVVARNITARKNSIQKLVESEEKYRNLVETIEEGMAIVDVDHNFVFVNNAAAKIYGYTKEEILSMQTDDILTSEAKAKLIEHYEERKKGNITKYENWNICKNGEKKLLRISSSPIFKNGEFAGSVSIFSDITKFREASEKLKASLKEKEVMLQEIYHRVKNNMQIISSMLKLQSKYIDQNNAREIFKNSQNRVKSMSLVHEKLYLSHDLSKIDARDYFTSLMKQIFLAYGNMIRNITYSIDCDDIELSLNTAIPCGLIANELVTNSLKHAFKDQKGKVSLKFYRTDDDKLRLEIGNDGKNFPADFKLESATSFGLQLVNILSSQLHADFKFVKENGVNFIFIFEDLKPNKKHWSSNEKNDHISVSDSNFV